MKYIEADAKVFAVEALGELCLMSEQNFCPYLA